MDTRDTYPPDGWTNIPLPTTSPDAWAAKRQSVNHPAFPQLEPTATVWRYMSFAKFASFLSTRSLYFARADQFGDEWEGAIPEASAQTYHAFIDKAKKGGPEAATKDWRTAWVEAYEHHKWSVFVSCWFCKNTESDQMWVKYAEKPFGVAIRSTYERLNSALPLAWESRDVLLGKVTYGDYKSPTYVRDVTNHLNLFMSKRLEHEDDREVRAVIQNWQLTKDRAHIGLVVPILAHTLVEAVVIAPTAPTWFARTVESICRVYRLDVPVEPSVLDRKPRIPF